jgi:hypothetical protein
LFFNGFLFHSNIFGKYEWQQVLQTIQPYH